MRAEPTRINWLIVLGFWAVISIMYVARTLTTGDAAPLISDTDDAMRLALVQDFLGGQGWFDHTQYRLNVPFGAEIHWSRFVDLPLAGVQLLLTPILGANAVLGAAIIWPLLLLLALLALSAKISVYFTGRDGLLPGLALPVLSAVVLVEFAPGRVDHHNIQIILCPLIAYATVRSWQVPRYAILAGLAAATSLAIGLETLPLIVPAILAYGLGFVLRSETAGQMRGFGVSFGLGTLAHLMLALPPERWLVPACDAISMTFAVAAIGVGAGFVALTLVPKSTMMVRLLTSVLIGGGLVAALVFAFPACLSGPYAGMDPWLAENWLSRIIEAKPVWTSFAGLPAYTIGIILPPLAAVIVLAVILTRSEGVRRAEWATLGVFLIVGLIVTLLQIRGARLLAPLIVPVAAWLIVVARQKYLDRRNWQDALALVGSWLIFAGLAVALVAGWLLPRGGDEVDLTAEAGGNRYQCLMSSAFTDLAALPPERIMAPVDLGAHILLFTDHAVVGAPYHRNQHGVLDTFHFFNQPIDQAREILEERGITLIVTCPWLNEMQGFQDTSDDSLVRRLARDDLPDWLEDVSLPDGVLNVFAVVD